MTINEFSSGISANSSPQYIAAGQDGNLWFTEGRGGAIGRITPQGTVAEFIDRVTGAESPLSHGTLEPVEGAPGDETAHIQFRVCAAWKPPPDRTDESFKLIKQAGPDAPEPPEVSQRVGGNAWEETEHPVLRKSEIGGCGQKH